MAASTYIRHPLFKETIMRLTSIAIMLSLTYAVTSSIGQAQDPVADPRAAVLIAEGQAALKAGEPQNAIDLFEAALVVDPAYTPIFLKLGEATRAEGLQGKAITYYKEVLARDPGNLAALSGEGEALMEKGAVEKAREKLAELQGLCGPICPEANELAATIAAGPQPQTLRAEAVVSDAEISQN